LITMIGHLAKDVNIYADGRMDVVPGGGVFYGGIAVRKLGEGCAVITKCSRKDLHLFKLFDEVGVNVKYVFTDKTTSIENRYPSSNPDERHSRMVEKADPFDESDIPIDGKFEYLHITPLWYGEFPENLIELLRKRSSFLSIDAQGFVRRVREDGEMVREDWENKEKYMRYVDLLKVDSKEAEVLTGTKEIERSAIMLHEFGSDLVILTHSNGVILYDGKKIYRSNFGSWKIEGRTGRGDTCVSSFIVGLKRGYSLQKALDFSADITTKKMNYPGPYVG